MSAGFSDSRLPHLISMPATRYPPPLSDIRLWLVTHSFSIRFIKSLGEFHVIIIVVISFPVLVVKTYWSRSINIFLPFWIECQHKSQFGRTAESSSLWWTKIQQILSFQLVVVVLRILNGRGFEGGFSIFSCICFKVDLKINSNIQQDNYEGYMGHALKVDE